MKNKFILTVIVMAASLCSANAASEKIHVSALEKFNTLSPSKTINVTVLNDSKLGDYELKAGDTLNCNIVKVFEPKRGKRSASFVVTPTSYNNGVQDIKINECFYGKYAAKILSKDELKNIDAVKVGKKTALAVGNHFVKGVAPIASLAEGMIKNEEGNRLESGVKQVYKDSPVAYIEKGKQLNINEGDSFYLIFKEKKNKKSSFSIDAEDFSEDNNIERE